VILWFVGVSIAFVWMVFRSPALDYRLVALGSVLPVGEVVLGGPGPLHTLVGPVALLAVVMLATQKQRLVRRRLIGIPIGMLMHLVLDGSWTQTEIFWWPLTGGTLFDGSLPELDRPLGVILVLDALGAAALVWCWRTFGFDVPSRRDEFFRTGHLPRDLEV